jgi:hypothetical protein
MEHSAALERAAGRSLGVTTLVPGAGFEPQTRDLTVGGTPSAVGVAVKQAPGVLGWSAVVASGAQLLGPLRDDTKIFHDQTLPTATWTAENAAVVPADPVFTYSVLKPKRVTASFIISQQLLSQTASLALDRYLAEKMKLAFGSVLDQSALYGVGVTGNQPLGVLNTTGTQAFTMAASPAWADIATARYLVTNADVDRSSFGWITSPKGRKYLETTPRFATAAATMWDGMAKEAEISLEVTDGRLFAGCWAYLVIGFWAGDSAGPATDLTVDAFTRARQAEIVVTGTMLCDIAVRWPAVFGFSAANVFP